MPEPQAVAMVLNSWKEIAGYVGRGVRTVQRWEADLSMPVRRPRAKSRSAVIAMSDEIDRWLRSAPTAELPGDNHIDADTKARISGLRQSMAEHVTLRTRCTELRSGHADAVLKLISNLELLRRSLGQEDKKRPEPIQEKEKNTAA